MRDKRVLIEQIKELNNAFSEVNKENTNLVIEINKEIMKRDIEDYLNKNSIDFNINKFSTYEILGAKPFEEIAVDDFGFSIRLKELYINFSFNIESEKYYTYTDMFTINRDHYLLMDESYLNKLYNLDIEVINNLLNEYRERILDIQKQIEYIKVNNELDKYNYSLYNKVYAPEVFFNNIDEIMDYVQRSI